MPVIEVSDATFSFVVKTSPNQEKQKTQYVMLHRSCPQTFGDVEAAVINAEGVCLACHRSFTSQKIAEVSKTFLKELLVTKLGPDAQFGDFSSQR